LIVTRERTGISFINLSSSYRQAGDLQMASESAREALRIFQNALPPSHPYVLAAQQAVHGILNCIHELAFASDDSSAHAASVHRMRDAGGIVIARHRGGGFTAPDYSLQFRNFNTFAADVRLCGGCFYWEVEVVDIVGAVQFGVCTEGFEARENAAGEGVGDDAWSWAADGVRLLKWHEGNQGAHGSAWAVGDVIGFAVDMRTAGAAIVSVSVNGSFAAPNGPVFAAIGAPYLSPALSASGGSYRLNLGDRPFAHAPPGYAHYVSVHVCHQQRQQHQEC
jgi:hypothetical protein